MGRATSTECVPTPARPRLLVSSWSQDGSFQRLACLLGVTPGRSVYRCASTSPGGEMSLRLRVCRGSEFLHPSKPAQKVAYASICAIAANRIQAGCAFRRPTEPGTHNLTRTLPAIDL